MNRIITSITDKTKLKTKAFFLVTYTCFLNIILIQQLHFLKKELLNQCCHRKLMNEFKVKKILQNFGNLYIPLLISFVELN